MSDTPSDRKYLQTHEWHKPAGDVVTLGITQFAADELTDITYVALPKVGQTFKAGDRFGEVESVKATSDMYTGVAGTVTEINEAVNADPGLVNRDPYEAGWLIKLKATNAAELDGLLAVDDYLKKIGH
ncbi:MAG TPA: glycine cleavage system protein GcvH [Tepidisphaeraceae bacterium]|jgi:glycine cleavage system H protein|nr:glycine cleavage system protein GcvH [Tepidisphaeraceae bacterium]